MDNPISDQTVKILTLGDPHITIGSLKITDQLIDLLIIEIKNTQPDIFVIMGDVLDRFNQINAEPLCKAVELIRKVSSLVKTVLLIGNHDIPNKTHLFKPINPFTALHGQDNIIIADTRCECFIVKGKKFLAMPYVPNGEFLKGLETANENIDDIYAIFAHQEFYKCQLEGFRSKGGDKIPVKNFPLVISGHIHKYHRPQENIIYVGTPHQHDFGDMTEKSISLFTFFDDKSYVEKRIYLNLPKRVIIDIKTSEIESWKPPKNCIIKLILKGTVSENSAAKKFPIIKQWRQDGIKIVFEDIFDEDDENTDNDESDNTNVTILTFSQTLQKLIKNKKHLQSIYNEISNS